MSNLDIPDEMYMRSFDDDPSPAIPTNYLRAKAADPPPGNIAAIAAKMSESPDDAAAQSEGCAALRSLALDDPTVNQAAIVEAGGDMLAMKAMGTFKENEAALQASCAECLAALAHWNLDVATQVGRNGAIEAIAQSQKLYPSEYKIGVAATDFTDWPDRSGSEANLESIQRSGLMDMVYDNFEKHDMEPEVALKALEFFANACRPPELREQMIQRGYLKKSIKVMQDFPHYPGLRGQVAWVNLECFMDPRFMAEQVEAGMIPEMIKMLKDADTDHLDLLEDSRAVKNAIAILKSFAGYSGDYIDAIAEQGVIEQLVHSVKKQQFKADVVVEACTLAQLLAQARWAIPAVMNHQLHCDFKGSPKHKMQGPYVPANTPWRRAGVKPAA